MALATIPLRDVSPRRHVPWTVLTLIALNVLVFLFLQPASLQQGKVDTRTLTEEESRELSEHTAAWGAVPCEVRNLQSRSDGARCTSDGDTPIIDGKPIALTLLTSMFLHGSIQHLAFNMLILFIFGAAVEERFGAGGLLGIYLLGGLIGGLTHVVAVPGSALPMIGASGAISAVMGAFLVGGARRRILALVQPLPLLLVTLPAWALLAPYLVSQFATPDDALIAWRAHVGGMIAGLLIALVLSRFIPTLDDRGHRVRATPTDRDAPADPSTWTVPDAPPVEQPVG